MADSSENHATVVLLEAEAEAEAGGGPSSADERQPPAPDDAAVVLRPKQHWLHGVARVVCECMLIACLFVISSMEVREGPCRRHQLALVGLAYVAMAAFVWLGRALPADGSTRWKKLAAKLAATAVVGVLAYCTNSVVWPAAWYLLIYN